MEERSNLIIEEILEELDNINKDKLSERQFFQSVISQMNRLKGIKLSSEDCEKISKKIKQIGCVDFKEWKEEKICEGKVIKDSRLIAGTRNGSLVIGAAFVGYFVKKEDVGRSIHTYTESCIADPKRKSNMYEVWLKNSQRIIDEGREDESLVDVSKEEMEYNKQAIIRMKRKIEEKREITKEIEDIEEKIERLKAELFTKKSRLKEINEEESKEELKMYGK